MASVTGQEVEPAEPVSLRDRRRAQTEQEVGEVALTLFERQGIDATTVDEIAREAGVSPRTFFRYFQTKERAVLAPHRELEERIAAMLGDLRADRALLPQLESVWRVALAALGDGRSEPGRQLLRVRRLMRSEPTLRLAAASLDEDRHGELAAQLRTLLGDDDEVAVRVVIETASAPVRVALDHWADAEEAAAPVGLLETYEQCLDAQRRARSSR